MSKLRILVPVDFSEWTDAAVACAANLARRFGGEVHVLHIWNPRTGAWCQEECQSDVVPVVDTSVRWGRVTIRSRVALGEPHATILQIAACETFDFIVIGIPERFRWPYFFASSLASKLARQAACPIITVRATMNPDPATGSWASEGGAVANDTQVKRALFEDHKSAD